MRDGRSEILITAIFFSVMVHVGTMFYAKTKVMTEVAPGAPRAVRREPMRVTRNIPPPDTVKIEAVRDVDALKDAPKANDIAPTALESVIEEKKIAPSIDIPNPEDPPPAPIDVTTLDISPISIDKSPSKLAIPMSTIEVPKIASSSEGLPASLKESSPVLPSAGSNADSLFAPTQLSIKEAVEERKISEYKKDKEEQKEANKEEKKFVPDEKIREKVDEKVVAQEKAAVRELINDGDAEELTKCVNATMVQEKVGEWTYFKVMMVPRHELQVVEKDVVFLIDASGSIGTERIDSVCKAVERIIRNATNSGDRFNLVAFRNRYTYAFDRWQECTQQSFAQADRWLSKLAAHGRTDVFGTISSVLTLPRTPERPLIALVMTDGDANVGVRQTAQIISKFTALNDGLISVYMYGVKASANRELIDVLTHGNRGESFIFTGMRWWAGSGIENLAERFRDPVLSDLRVVFAAGTKAESYPRLLKNFYRGDTLEIYGRVPSGVNEVAFSLKGLNGKVPYEGFFKLPLAVSSTQRGLAELWAKEKDIDSKLR